MDADIREAERAALASDGDLDAWRAYADAKERQLGPWGEPALRLLDATVRRLAHGAGVSDSVYELQTEVVHSLFLMRAETLSLPGLVAKDFHGSVLAVAQLRSVVTVALGRPDQSVPDMTARVLAAWPELDPMVEYKLANRGRVTAGASDAASAAVEAFMSRRGHDRIRAPYALFKAWAMGLPRRPSPAS